MFGPTGFGYWPGVSHNVKLVTRDGQRDYVGSPICEGPGIYRLMLTWPFKAEGQIVEVPLEDIEEIVEVTVGELGKPPRVTSAPMPA